MTATVQKQEWYEIVHTIPRTRDPSGGKWYIEHLRLGLGGRVVYRIAKLGPYPSEAEAKAALARLHHVALS